MLIARTNHIWSGKFFTFFQGNYIPRGAIPGSGAKALRTQAVHQWASANAWPCHKHSSYLNLWKAILDLLVHPSVGIDIAGAYSDRAARKAGWNALPQLLRKRRRDLRAWPFLCFLTRRTGDGGQATLAICYLTTGNIANTGLKSLTGPGRLECRIGNYGSGICMAQDHLSYCSGKACRIRSGKAGERNGSTIHSGAARHMLVGMILAAESTVQFMDQLRQG